MKTVTPRLPAKAAPWCPKGCHNALDFALITDPKVRDPRLLSKLDAVAGRVLGKVTAAH